MVLVWFLHVWNWIEYTLKVCKAHVQDSVGLKWELKWCVQVRTTQFPKQVDSNSGKNVRRMQGGHATYVSKEGQQG